MMYKVVFQPTRDPSVAPFKECFDLMGDGSLILLSTPGHTPGSLSMLVNRTGSASLLLIGDLAYDAGALERHQIPGTGDKRTLISSYRKVSAFKDRHPDLLVLPCHDWKANERCR